MIRLSDVFIPAVYGTYTAVNNPEKSALIAMGVVRTDPLLNQIAKEGGKTCVVPFWKDIDPTIEPNYSNDDPNDLAVPYGIQSGTMTARKAWLNQAFGEMDLVPELAGSDPLQHIRNRFGTYWTRQQQRRLIATLTGVFADNIANDNSDMVVDISAQPDQAGVFGSDAFIDAAYTAGDQADMFTAIAVHGDIMRRMVKNDEVEEESVGGLIIPTYKGRRIVIDDTMPVSGAGANRVYTSFLFGTGAIGFGGVEGNAFAAGEGVSKVASEVTRTAEAGNGGGMESIWERKTWVLHPYGMEWIESGAALTEMSPTLADLRLAAHWSRVVDRKQVPLAAIKSRA